MVSGSQGLPAKTPFGHRSRQTVPWFHSQRVESVGVFGTKEVLFNIMKSGLFWNYSGRIGSGVDLGVGRKPACEWPVKETPKFYPPRIRRSAYLKRTTAMGTLNRFGKQPRFA
jgi:hypothetical protein